ncbi:MAG: DNA repair protein RecO, partial [Planctomycetota bacterium]|nr:DNA repair protein RecO [Planctomycetota bacterium]
MTAEKSLAIVLRVVEFSESSYIVTLFTDNFGRVSALAKGARRPKGPFESALDLLALCRVVFLRKPGDSLDLLTEAKLERRFRAAARSLPRFYAGLYIAELLLAWTEHSDSNTPLFILSAQAITGLDNADSVTRTILHFEIRGLHLLGLLPSLVYCVECGPMVDVAQRAAFGLQAGGVLCPRCKPGKRQVISISKQARWLMQALAQSNHYSDLNRQSVAPDVDPTVMKAERPDLAWGEL